MSTNRLQKVFWSCSAQRAISLAVSSPPTAAATVNARAAATAARYTAIRALSSPSSSPSSPSSSPSSSSSSAPAGAVPQRMMASTAVAIADDSWGAEGLEKQGEKLASSKDKPVVLVDDEFLSGPPPEAVKKLCDEILALNVTEVHQLLQLIQSRLGITDEMLGGFGGGGGGGSGGGAAAADAAAAAPAAAEPAKEKEVFDIKLTVVDAKAKIKIIKEVRTITGLGLKEAKDLVEKAPCVLKQGVKKEEAEQFKKLLIDAGAQVELS